LAYGAFFVDSILEINNLIIRDASSRSIVNDNASGKGWIAISGGIGVNKGGKLFANNCLFIDNCASFGGAIDTQPDCFVELNNCSFSNNYSINGGAINISSGSTLIATNCTFANNNAISSAGAIRVAGTNEYANNKVFLYHCTFDNNTIATDTGGAAIYIHGSGE